jgi:hypothetical protein
MRDGVKFANCIFYRGMQYMNIDHIVSQKSGCFTPFENTFHNYFYTSDYLCPLHMGHVIELLIAC